MAVENGAISLREELQITLKRLAPNIQIVNEFECQAQNEQASLPHLIILLTAGFLKPDGTCVDPIAEKTILSRMGRKSSAAPNSAGSFDGQALMKADVVFVYSHEYGWDFPTFYALPETEVKAAIAGHEAICYRPLSPSARAYEHDAMVMEVIRRLRPVGCNNDGARLLRRIHSDSM